MCMFLSWSEYVCYIGGADFHSKSPDTEAMLLHSGLFTSMSQGSTFSRRMSADTVFCHVFFGLPTGVILFTTNLTNAFTQSVSPFLSICQCHLRRHFLITSPIASTVHLSYMHLLSSVQSHIPWLVSVQQGAYNACLVNLALHPRTWPRYPDW